MSITSTSSLRVVSLLPSATEILFALGAGRHVVGVTHECDYPAAATLLPPCTASLLPANLTSSEIDVAVCNSLTADPHSVYSLDIDLLHRLQPTMIITQALCAVCAVPESTVRKVACSLPTSCRVVAADPHSLAELFTVIQDIATAIGFRQSGERLVPELKRRLLQVRAAVPLRKELRVAVLEWPDPPYAGGHWVPDQIEAAGGVCVLGKTGEKSMRVTWESLINMRPHVVVCAFCGFDLHRNEEECDKVRTSSVWKEFVKGATVYATNASAYFSRPGDRLIDGTELMAFLLHGIAQYRPEPGAASVLLPDGWRDVSTIPPRSK